jgi:hypothetical protein
MQNARTAIDNDDPRRVWIARLGDLWQGPHNDNNDNNDNNADEDDDDPRAGYVRRLTSDSGVPNFGVRMNDSRVDRFQDSVGPSTLPSTGAALRQIREDRQRQGATS